MVRRGRRLALENERPCPVDDMFNHYTAFSASCKDFSETPETLSRARHMGDPRKGFPLSRE
jgi:hypothetical protein